MGVLTYYIQFQSPLAGPLNWLPPPSSTASECAPTPIGSKCQVGGGHTLGCGKGLGGTNSDEGTNIVLPSPVIDV
jgi:hypothetical protein